MFKLEGTGGELGREEARTMKVERLARIMGVKRILRCTLGCEACGNGLWAAGFAAACTADKRRREQDDCRTQLEFFKCLKASKGQIGAEERRGSGYGRYICTLHDFGWADAHVLLATSEALLAAEPFRWAWRPNGNFRHVVACAGNMHSTRPTRSPFSCTHGFPYALYSK